MQWEKVEPAGPALNSLLHHRVTFKSLSLRHLSFDLFFSKVPSSKFLRE
jgi:hypothetical protein